MFCEGVLKSSITAHTGLEEAVLQQSKGVKQTTKYQSSSGAFVVQVGVALVATVCTSLTIRAYMDSKGYPGCKLSKDGTL